MTNDPNKDHRFDLEVQQPQEPKPAAARSRSPRASAGPRVSKDQPKQVISYRFGNKRKNNPHVGMVNTTSDGVEEETVWAYDPHIDPSLNFDVGRSQIENLIDDALASGDQAAMRQALEQLRRMQTPYLNWTGKAEGTSFEVDTVSLHVHERIDPAPSWRRCKSASRAAKAKAAPSSPICSRPRLRTCRYAKPSTSTSTSATGPTG